MINAKGATTRTMTISVKAKAIREWMPPGNH